MSLSASDIEQLPYVEAALNYIVPMAEKPHTYTYDPPPNVARSNSSYESHRVRIRDMRPAVGELSLEEEGFTLRDAPSAVRDFYAEDELRATYYPEVEQLVGQLVSAARVVVFDHTIRRRIEGVEDRTAGAPRQPVPRVHNDYTLESGPQRVRDLCADEAEGLLRGRFSLINVWRPIRAPLEDSPLALCDARSLGSGDLIATDLLYRDRTGEIYNVRYSPAHRWFYAPRMRRDEVLVFRCYDSAQDGRARFVPHTAFEDPAAPAVVIPRESIELRALAFFD
ncbi:MAG TPA: CmcJ/NvfI family oxidoreductase [Steroidobacteraceae bacterium]|nr:CmcJ/NvfI family oxidoreductase [Steroidobacteraceae bacterium]